MFISQSKNKLRRRLKLNALLRNVGLFISLIAIPSNTYESYLAILSKGTELRIIRSCGEITEEWKYIYMTIIWENYQNLWAETCLSLFKYGNVLTLLTYFNGI